MQWREVVMITDDISTLARIVGVSIVKLSNQTLTKINDAPHAQLRTSNYKKAVYIVRDLIYKGPYASDDPRLMNNLKLTCALQLLEEALGLSEWQRASLPWECIGHNEDHQYFLVAPNVGSTRKIPFNVVSSKIETNVPIVPRGGIVRRVSEIEKNGRLTDEIKIAALQHLYFRFLLDIGDSGTHNVLIREDYKVSGRLVAGIDLEEKRAPKGKASRLDHLFKKGPSKIQASLYATVVNEIRVLCQHHLNQITLDGLNAVGIDLNRLRVNMKRW
jgi:hypothetical protein